MRFVVTTRRHLAGVFLSRPGHFGNLPFADDAAATAHARELAKGKPITVERETAKAHRR